MQELGLSESNFELPLKIRVPKYNSNVFDLSTTVKVAIKRVSL